jgi:hypothetical protein
MNLDCPVHPDPYPLLPAVPSFTLTSADPLHGKPLTNDQVAESEGISAELSWSDVRAIIHGTHQH